MTQTMDNRLNRFTILRYDTAHEPEQAVGTIPDELEPEDFTGDDHMDVNGINSVGRSVPLSNRGVSHTPPVGRPATPAAPQDEIQISSEARKLESLSRSGDLREGRLAQIREAIANGTYDTPEKLEIALDRLLEQHGFDAGA